MGKKTLVDEIAESMLDTLTQNNDDPETYWAKKSEAQASIEGSIVPKVTGPQELSFSKPKKSQR